MNFYKKLKNLLKNLIKYLLFESEEAKNEIN